MRTTKNLLFFGLLTLFFSFSPVYYSNTENVMAFEEDDDYDINIDMDKLTPQNATITDRI